MRAVETVSVSPKISKPAEVFRLGLRTGVVLCNFWFFSPPSPHGLIITQSAP